MYEVGSKGNGSLFVVVVRVCTGLEETLKWLELNFVPALIDWWTGPSG